MIYIVSVEDYFSSAHQLRGYKGKCENMHGHNWRVVLKVKGDKLNDIGILIDFHDLKDILKSILKELDHKNLNEMLFFSKINPSSEIISGYIAEMVDKKLNELNYKEIIIDSVTVWESSTSSCTYKP